MLKNASTIAIRSVDKADNEPSKVSQKSPLENRKSCLFEPGGGSLEAGNCGGLVLGEARRCPHSLQKTECSGDSPHDGGKDTTENQSKNNQ